MTNPYAAFEVSDDEDNYTKVNSETQKVKRTHQEKKQFKLQQQSKPVVSQTTQDNTIFQRQKENQKQIRNNRAPPTPQTKKLNDGHYLDRRSGTGREDRPRKEGGGRGNIGNVKDQLNRDKYEKEPAQNKQGTTAEQGQTAQGAAETQPKVEEAPKLTLEEYYRNQGVEISNVYEKKVLNRGEVEKAEWIKKEKLTIVESKQTKKNEERNAQNVLKFKQVRVGLDENLQGLGFGQKPQRKQEQKREPREQKPEYKGKGGRNNNSKAVINNDDFPTL